MIAYKLADNFEYDGINIKLCLSFDTVLRFYDMQKDDRLSDVEKLNLSLEMLVMNYKDIKNFNLVEKTKILKFIFNDFISVKIKPSSNTERLYDFSQDSGYIFSSFWMDYGIDLQAEQGKLDWRKFIVLFQGLSERTKMHEIIAIRAREIPKPTKYNADEIKALCEAKAYYALEISAEEAEHNFQHGLNKIGNKLASMAKGR
jgi:hypothetical protein